jgi:hypothetical protein
LFWPFFQLSNSCIIECRYLHIRVAVELGIIWCSRAISFQKGDFWDVTMSLLSHRHKSITKCKRVPYGGIIICNLN